MPKEVKHEGDLPRNLISFRDLGMNYEQEIRKRIKESASGGGRVGNVPSSSGRRELIRSQTISGKKAEKRKKELRVTP